VTIEAAKVVGASKASTPNQLITYFDESHIDLTNVVDTKGQEEVIDIKVQFRASTHRLGGGGGRVTKNVMPEMVSVFMLFRRSTWPEAVMRSSYLSVNVGFRLRLSKQISIKFDIRPSTISCRANLLLFSVVAI
jgi:hypothetical protein